jgi:hypothetical protein
MFRHARGFRRLASATVLISLLLVPLALGVHHHANHETAPNCAVCLVSHCSPIEPPTGVVLPAAVRSASAVPPLRTITPGRTESPVRVGRAPPLALDVSVV